MKRDISFHRDRAEKFVAGLSFQDKMKILYGTFEDMVELGLFFIYFTGEAAHGVQARHDQSFDLGEPVCTTVFSNPIGMAASFDKELMHSVGNVVGTEMRSLANEFRHNGLLSFAPTVDMERDPRWGRNEEAYGEKEKERDENTEPVTEASDEDGEGIPGIEECGEEIGEDDAEGFDQADAWKLAEHRDGKYLFVGGHPDKKAMLMKIYPNSYFFDSVDRSTISTNNISCEHAFIFWNMTAHSTIKKALSGIVGRDIGFSYIRNGNICRMVRSIEAELRKKEEKTAMSLS